MLQAAMSVAVIMMLTMVMIVMMVVGALTGVSCMSTSRCASLIMLKNLRTAKVGSPSFGFSTRCRERHSPSRPHEFWAYPASPIREWFDRLGGPAHHGRRRLVAGYFTEWTPIELCRCRPLREYICRRSRRFPKPNACAHTRAIGNLPHRVSSQCNRRQKDAISRPPDEVATPETPDSCEVCDPLMSTIPPGVGQFSLSL